MSNFIPFVVAAAAAANRVGWWWDAPTTSAADPRAVGLISFAKAHTDIVSTVLMRCGPSTKNGSIVGDVVPACARVIPSLAALGVESELWLGETDDVAAAVTLMKDPASVVARLKALGAAHPGLRGFNFDLEISSVVNCTATQRCDDMFAGFLAAVKAGVGGAFRITADVDCSPAGRGYAPIMSNCSLLASAADAVMDMRTYNGVSERAWYEEAAPALGISGVNIGLGCWNDSRTEHTWALTSESAKQRVCYLLNHSVSEVDMFRLNFDAVTGAPVWPYPFWIGALERYVQGGGCEPAPLPTGHCPADGGWVDDASVVPGFAACCTLSAKAENRTACAPKTSPSACAQQQCEAAAVPHVWVPRDYSHFPYTCCLSPGALVPVAGLKGAMG